MGGVGNFGPFTPNHWHCYIKPFQDLTQILAVITVTSGKILLTFSSNQEL